MKNFNLLLFTTLFAAVVGFAFLKPMKQYEYMASYKKSKKMPLEQRIEGRNAVRAELLRNVETGIVNPDDWYRVNAQIDKQFGSRISSRADGLEWEMQGPDQVSGRIRGFVFDKLKDGRVYSGGVSGGIYVSDNLGHNWRPVKNMADVFKIMSIGCMTQSKNGDIYAGTGEYWGNTPTGNLTSQFFGNGIYKLKAGEEDWVQLASTIKGNLTTVNETQDFRQVIDISCDPQDNDLIYAATSNGLQISTDGGSSWKKATTGTNNPGINPIAQVKVAIDGTVYAGWLGKVYKSEDKGANWKDLMPTARYKDSFTADGSRHLRIALSQKDAGKIYVCGVTSNGDLKYVVRSTDAGSTWIKIGQRDATLEPLCTELNGQRHCQGWYDLCLAVHPLDDNKIYLGGSVKTYNWSERYGWIQMSNWAGPASLGVNLIHADNHEFAFHPTHPDTMVICTDGGPYISYNSNSSFPNPTWKPILTNFNITQFYDMAVNKYGELVGGSQDNGSHFITLNNQGNQSLRINAGDGFDAEISASNDYQVAYSTVYEGTVERTTNLTSNNSTVASGCVQENNQFTSIIFHTRIGLVEKINTTPEPDEVENSFLFVFNDASQYTMSINAHKIDDPKIAWTNWFNPGIGGIRGIHAAKDLSVVYICGASGVKYSNGLLGFDTLKNIVHDKTPCKANPLTWSSVTGVGGSLSDIYVDQSNPKRVVTVQYGFGGTAKVYFSTNGTSFTSKQGNLPIMPVYSCAIDPSDEKHVVVGTEFGIWETFNIDEATPQWVESNKEIGRVPVFKLRVNYLNKEECTMLYAGTHGRGFWRAPFPKKSECEPYTKVPRKNTNSIESLNNLRIKFDVYPNPTSDRINVSFNTEKPSTCKLMIYDMQGRIVKQFSYKAISGDNTLSADLSSLENAKYIVRLENNNNVIGGKILVKN